MEFGELEHGTMMLMPRPKDIEEKQTALLEPDERPYSLKYPKATTYSQWRQDITLAPIFHAIGNKGFFVESGAFTGEAHSNTLLLEKKGWNGLLVEPATNFANTLKSKHRKAHLFEGALSPTGSRELVKFFGWSIQDGKKKGKAKINDGAYQVVAEPLQTLMQTLHKKTVDFWSLDIEGFEGQVLNSTDFRKVEVGVLLIEVNHQKDTLVEDVMARQGFQFIGNTHYQKDAIEIKDARPEHPWLVLDAVYVNPAYFKRRSLPLPKRINENPHVYDCTAAQVRKERELKPFNGDLDLLKTC